MILSFQKQFREKILLESKKHTIRRDRHDRWKAGKIIHFSTGLRTKDYECFMFGKCESIQIIRIKWKDNRDIGHGQSVQVFIDDKNVTTNDDIIDALVENDGFESRREFFEWFSEDFNGKLIHWTTLKY